ncbi:hypothetical protein ERICIV_04177 [Paenibacillus larvae subsp. larvae]|uniref:Uncharacterized protein n=1 Tax=Paenibacillus larvae subsp. larvae TaxID=147375 RepID=A0A2L1UJ83_9BACL|nr:hypothetical protein [Paenibacillus larvae]AQT84737.1 hypothetical protein B1222_10580 [Paenibacillus larvae subsp. pulvifaciens]AQZ46732.1 hypothetical protein B5S25_09040 [Paenibacillus larvae subsp. pulvifaciens]AVF28491.1 hypothetical protein ERICIII_04432 [Paenibacillus larvae subsp. larvae]AVF32996.1 hypothetical protein ERICIV_04177 [Paenibacillus larvae subsp. larvae]MBH0342346.1 hypothetical protein [Paenibacillus larvae]
MTLTFTVTDSMLEKVEKWDQCKAVDVSGARFSYTFIPSGIGTVVKVHCFVCNRELDITEDWG